MLSDQQLEFYQQNGYLLIKDFATKQEVEQLRLQITTIIEESKVNENAIFSTKTKGKSDLKYFLESGDKIRCFYEDTSNDKSLTVNKVGHALHDLDPVFETFSYNKRFGIISRQLGHQAPTILQSQYIFKSPGVGGEVIPHTDSTFLYTDPQTCIGAWIAIDEATTENGCLWVLPGSHKHPLKERYVVNKERSDTSFVPMAENPPEWDFSNKTALTAKPGTLVLLHGSVVHYSAHNHSKQSRHAYILHLIDSTAKYPSNNWLKRKLRTRILQ